MNSQARLIVAVAIIGSCALIQSCGSGNPLIRKNAPSIAHIHIGHAITGWHAAPKKQGLLVIAELRSVEAATTAELLLRAARDKDLEKAQRYMKDTALAVDPLLVDPELTEEYGLRRATAEAMTHLSLSRDTDDASNNVQRTVTQTNIKAQDILDRSDELISFLDIGLESQSIDEIEIIAEEINLAMKGIAGGPEIQGNYGLFEFREDIEQMVARENPAYETVDSWYLFNLVKLPDGQWGFSSRGSRGAAGAGY